EILEGICGTRYRFTVVGESVIHIRPRNRNQNSPLERRVKQVSVQNVPYDFLVRYPETYISELRRKTTAVTQFGSRMGAADSPTINLNLRDVTVREVLNLATVQAARATKSAKSGWVYDPSPTTTSSTVARQWRTLLP